ncbi:uncharacterized protein LOC117319993 [Pecten maximus]|uniref:uncharacterized protein LOC117319993 n=1 Tax=Pecten maximus TaxID=6579 RepID=UPI001458BF3C|nr:uncharacterized protein LOC117319993 [Pecten maximus]
MLRAVAFKNFLCFEDYQSLEFRNGPNFIVGANATGKSAIFELIRRCLSRKASSLDSKVTDKSQAAFVICKFKVREELSDKVPAECTLYSLYVKYSIGGNEKKYKLVCITDEDETYAECYLSWHDDLKVTLKGDKKDVLEAMKSLFTKDNDPEQLIKTISNKIHGVTEGGTEEALSDCEPVLEKLYNVVVATFPIRSPGPIQWSLSEHIGEGEEHYITASKNAEILQRLIESEDVHETSKDIFQTIINPLKYKFKKDPNSIITADDGKRRIPLLKVPEGIIEAKQFSLMFAHKKFQTLMLEEPDRAMHPQMIQNLRDLLLRRRQDQETVIDQKTLILISHQPVMVNQWTMSRLYVCRKKRDASGDFKHWICNWSADVKNKHQHQDQLKQILYSANVLFVEGITDKSVIGWVFDRVLDVDGHKYLEDFTKTEQTQLKEIIAGTQIISMEGGKGYEHMRQAAEALRVPFGFLLDKDIAFQYQNYQLQLKINKVYKTFTSESMEAKENIALFKKSLELPSPFQLNENESKHFDLPPHIKGNNDAKATIDFLREEKNVFLWDSRTLEAMMLNCFLDIRYPSTTSDQSTQTTSDKSTQTKKDKLTLTKSDRLTKTTSDRLTKTASTQSKPTTSDRLTQTTPTLSTPTTSDQSTETTSDLSTPTTSDKSTPTTSDLWTPTTSDLWTPTTPDKSFERIIEKLIPYLSNPKKTAILEMKNETAKELAECLLKGEEMRTFLRFLLRRRTNP